MFLVFGMPHGGYATVAFLLSEAHIPNVYPYAMRDEAGIDVQRMQLCTKVFVVVNRNADDAALEGELSRQSPGTKDEAEIDALHRQWRAALTHWRYQPEKYTGVFQTMYGLPVPTKPLGGIFFHRTPEKHLVISLDWDRLADAWRILEFILETPLCAIRLHEAMTAKHWWDGLKLQIQAQAQQSKNNVENERL